MKKLFLFIMVVFGAFFLASCGNSTLSAPNNFNVVSDIASWDSVEGATKYRLEFIGETTYRRVVTETSVDLTSLDLPFGEYTVKVQALSDKKESEYTTLTSTYKVVDKSIKVNSISGQDMLDQRFVKWMGRTNYNETRKGNTLFHSASGFEVKFMGTSVDVTLDATNYSYEMFYKRPYVVVVVDNDFENSQRIPLVEITTKLNLVTFEEDDGEVHTVSLYKSTESIDSHVYVKKLVTDGHFVEGVEYRERKIEVIGDSVSTGHGNLAASSTENKVSENSDALKAFPFLVSQELNAELNLIAASGWGLKASYWTDPKTLNMFDAYKKVDMFSEVDWTFANYIPDVVIIELGTNDWSYISIGGDEYEKTQKMNAYKQQYHDFLDFIHAIYPNAKILMYYGAMKEYNMYDAYEEVYEEAKDRIPGLQILGFDGDALGAASHPSAASHKEIADAIVAKVKEMMNW